MSQIGNFLNTIGFILSLMLVVLAVYAAWNKDKNLFQAALMGGIVVFLIVVFSSIALIQAFFQHVFSIEYVYNYSSTDLPSFYLFTGFWAGQEGSLLFWLLLICLFSAGFIYYHRDDELAPWAYSIILAVESFFLLLVTVPANPFKIFIDPATGQAANPVEGYGLNPLLQNLGMVFHPPTIFIGFALFTIPFAFAISSILNRDFSGRWVIISRKWALGAWLFLGIGNVLGAIWAYVELGWGGFWAWDPVENASLFPWLVATAYIHSVSVYEKRNTLKIWSYLLIFITFTLCIFGTFLTRSGVLTASVHSFGESPLGPYFLWFMALSTIALAYLTIKEYSGMSGKEIHTYLSREGAFAINNWLFTAFTLVVLWGTLLPLLTGQAGKEQMTLSKEFFYLFTSPIAYALVALIGICPYLIWERFNPERLKRDLGIAAAVAAVLVIPLAMFGYSSVFGVFGFFIGCFTLSSTLYIIWSEISANVKATGRSAGKAFYSLFATNKRRYGGYIAHFGVTIMFIGIVGATLYPETLQKTLAQGESMQLNDVRLVYEEYIEEQGVNFQTMGVKMSVAENGRNAGVLIPSMAFYENPETQTAEVAIKWGFFRDVYVALSQMDQAGKATIVLTLNPLTSWIWLGSLILFGGTVFALWPGKYPAEPAAVPEGTQDAKRKTRKRKKTR